MKQQIDEMAKDICKLGKPCSECSAYPDACKAVKYAERFYTADYRKQIEGKWIFEHESYGKMLCSNCKEEALVNDRNEYVDSDFCPNCGARMKGEEDEKSD